MEEKEKEEANWETDNVDDNPDGDHIHCVDYIRAALRLDPGQGWNILRVKVSLASSTILEFPNYEILNIQIIS